MSFEFSAFNLLNKHLKNASCKTSLLYNLREYLCECLMKNMDIRKCFQLINTLNTTLDDEEYTHICNGFVRFPMNNFTLLDVAMRSWSLGSYDYLHSGTPFITYNMSIELNLKHIRNVKCLVRFGAKSFSQCLIVSSLFKMAPDLYQVRTFLNSVLLTTCEIAVVRKHRKHMKAEMKQCRKYTKQIRIYGFIKSKETVEQRREERILRRKNKRTDWTCAICLHNTNRKQLVLKCSHRFHEQCFLRYLVTSKKDNCPYCRTVLDFE